MRSSTKAIIAAAILLTASSGAFAQNQPAIPQPVFAQPDDANLPTFQPQSAAQMPAQPNGGMSSAPTVGAEDPANRMSLEGGPQYVENVTDAANQRLDGLIGSASQRTGGSELEQMMAIRRSNMLLGLKREEAELAVGLWAALFNNESAREWRTREDNLAKEQRDAEAAAAASAARASSATITGAGGQAMQPMPVVYEINNGTAVILVPGGGEVRARAGTVLPNGMKVVSVGNFVDVDNGGERITLGFGTQSIAVAAPTSSMPQLAQPIALP